MALPSVNALAEQISKLKINFVHDDIFKTNKGYTSFSFRRNYSGKTGLFSKSSQSCFLGMALPPPSAIVPFRMPLPQDLTQLASSNMGQLQQQQDPFVKLKRRMNFECEICGKRLPSRREYVGHMNGRHLGQKPFSCEHCGRQFAYMTSLPMHKKTCPAAQFAKLNTSLTAMPEDRTSSLFVDSEITTSSRSTVPSSQSSEAVEFSGSPSMTAVSDDDEVKSPSEL